MATIKLAKPQDWSNVSIKVDDEEKKYPKINVVQAQPTQKIKVVDKPKTPKVKVYVKPKRYKVDLPVKERKSLSKEVYSAYKYSRSKEERQTLLSTLAEEYGAEEVEEEVTAISDQLSKTLADQPKPESQLNKVEQQQVGSLKLDQPPTQPKAYPTTTKKGITTEIINYQGKQDGCVDFARDMSRGGNQPPKGLYSQKDKYKAINSKEGTVGAWAVMPKFGSNGHVALVESINDDGTITIVEEGIGNTRQRRTGTPKDLKIEGYWTDPDMEVAVMESLATVDEGRVAGSGDIDYSVNSGYDISSIMSSLGREDPQEEVRRYLENQKRAKETEDRIFSINGKRVTKNKYLRYKRRQEKQMRGGQSQEERIALTPELRAPLQSRVPAQTVREEPKSLASRVGGFAKELLIPSRGYSEEQLAEAKPTLREKLAGLGRFGAELGATALTGAEYLTLSKFIRKPGKDDLTDKAIAKLEELGKPKTAGEAKTMRLGDIALAVPGGAVGKIKNVGKAKKAVSRVKKLEPLTKEAKKFKSADEFVNKFYTEPTYNLMPGQTRMTAEGFRESGLYHGANNIRSILRDGKLKARVSRLDDAGEKVISLTKSRGGADSYGIVFELDEKAIKDLRPIKEGIIKDGVKGFEYRTSKDIPLSDVRSVTLPLNKGEGVKSKVLIGFDGNKAVFKGASELAKEFESRGIKVFFNDGSFGNKSQLKDIWNKANKTKTILSKTDDISKVNFQLQKIGEARKIKESVSLAELNNKNSYKVLDNALDSFSTPAKTPVGGKLDDALKTQLKPKKPGLLRKLSNAFYPLKHKDKNTQEVVGDYIANKLMSKEKANRFSNILPKIDIGELKAYQAGKNTKNTKVIKKTFDKLYEYAQKTGQDVGYLRGYVPQVYANKQDEVIEAVAKYMRDNGVDDSTILGYVKGKVELDGQVANKLRMTSRFSKSRLFPNYDVAAKYGLKPKYKSMNKLAADYLKEVEETKNNADLVTNLLKNDKLSTYQEGKDWVSVNTPGSPTGYFAPPEIAKLLNGMFDGASPTDMGELAKMIVAGGAKVNKFWQELALSGGIPKTNANFWTFGQVVKSLTAAKGELLKGDVRGFTSEIKTMSNAIRSNLTDASINYFKKKQDIIDKMASDGIDLSYRIGQYNEIGRGWVKNFREGTVKKSFDKLFNEKTFQSFQPMQVITTYESTYKGALKKGMSELQARRLAKDVTINFQGLINAPGRSRAADDVLSTFFFAPRFRETVINVVTNTIRSVMPVTVKGRKIAMGGLFDKTLSKNRSLAIGMAIDYYVYNKLNQHYSGQNIWENPGGKELELKINGDKMPGWLKEKTGLTDDDIVYIPFMPSFMSMPRNIVGAVTQTLKGDFRGAGQKLGSFVSMPVKTLAELGTNRDYFGREIYDDTAPWTEQLQDMASYAFYASSHPYLRIVANKYNKYTNQEQLDKFKDILGMDKAGDREGVRNALDKLSPEEREAYYELKQKKIKGDIQGLAEGIEAPIRFTTKGGVSKQKMYQEREDFVRDYKKTKDRDIKREKLQEYINSLPNDEERKSFAYYLQDYDVSTSGIKLSENTITADRLYNRWKDLSEEDRKKAIDSWKKTVSKEKGQPILRYINQYKKDDMAREEGLIGKDENWMGRENEERARILVEKTRGMDNRIDYLKKLKNKGLISDELQKEYVKQWKKPVSQKESKSLAQLDVEKIKSNGSFMGSFKSPTDLPQDAKRGDFAYVESTGELWYV